MRVAVVGGKLQGLEAAYLAKKAGWQVVLIDKRQDVPALGISDVFYRADLNDEKVFAPIMKGIDFIIPALENRQVLQNLADMSERLGIPVALDLKAYDVSSSKSISDRLFAAIDIPAPIFWPECSFPVIIKPSGASGSEGVLRIQNASELRSFQKEVRTGIKNWVIQEFLEGPSYSIEVIGCCGKYFPLQVTCLEMDNYYDCKRVFAPANLSILQQAQFADIAVKIARYLDLSGIMDVEAIFHQGEFKVLEIDARLPSQTPTAVYQSTGLNLLELLAQIFIAGRLNEVLIPRRKRASVYEHIVVSPENITVSGEHAVSAAGPLYYIENFFGADEALTNYSPDKKNWMATLINTGSSLKAVEHKRDKVIDNIQSELKINFYEDPRPAVNDYEACEE